MKTNSIPSLTPLSIDGGFTDTQDCDGTSLPLALRTGEGEAVAWVYTQQTAERIVRAVNSHAELVAALESWMKWHDNPWQERGDSLHCVAVDATRAAIAKANA